NTTKENHHKNHRLTIKQLIAQGVADALAKIEANRTSRNGDENHDSGTGSRRTERAARECTYSNFLKFQPLNVKGTEGVVSLTQWFEKIESAFHISNCTVACQIKFATCTLLDSALTEIKKIKIELQNLKVKGTDVVSYTQHFQELALMCGRMFPEESDEVEKSHFDPETGGNKLLLTIIEPDAAIKCGKQGHSRILCHGLKTQNHVNQAGGSSFKHALDAFNTRCNVDALFVTTCTSAPQMMKNLAKCYFGVIEKDLVSKLSVPMFSEGSLCPSCNAHRMDQWGDHAVHCSSEVGVKFRHNLVRDILVDICSKVGIMVRKEAPMGFLSEDGKDLRPAYLLLFNWLQGKDACLDVTCISPFAGMGASSWAPGVALHNAVEKKKRKYVLIYEENGYKFIPFAFSTFWEFNTEALGTLSPAGVSECVLFEDLTGNELRHEESSSRRKFDNDVQCIVIIGSVVLKASRSINHVIEVVTDAEKYTSIFSKERVNEAVIEDSIQIISHLRAGPPDVPSMSQDRLTCNWYPAINKLAAMLHWLNHVESDAEYIGILDADIIMRGPITPWEFKAARGIPVSTPYDYGSTKCGLRKLQSSFLKECRKWKVGVYTTSPSMVLRVAFERKSGRSAAKGDDSTEAKSRRKRARHPRPSTDQAMMSLWGALLLSLLMTTRQLRL
ncbi:hypothetical protein Tco_0037876, partial [Tanacetum coccineum]